MSIYFCGGSIQRLDVKRFGLNAYTDVFQTDFQFKSSANSVMRGCVHAGKDVERLSCGFEVGQYENRLVVLCLRLYPSCYSLDLFSLEPYSYLYAYQDVVGYFRGFVLCLSIKYAIFANNKTKYLYY